MIAEERDYTPVAHRDKDFELIQLRNARIRRPAAISSLR
jgi:hypothetical protein